MVEPTNDDTQSVLQKKPRVKQRYLEDYFQWWDQDCKYQDQDQDSKARGQDKTKTVRFETKTKRPIQLA